MFNSSMTFLRLAIIAAALVESVRKIGIDKYIWQCCSSMKCFNFSSLSKISVSEQVLASFVPSAVFPKDLKKADVTHTIPVYREIP